MCGNFAALKSKRMQKKQLEDALLVEVILDQMAMDLSSEHIYPSASSWILDNQGQLRAATWGLVPPWAKDPKIARQTFNARSETVAEKPAFRDAFRSGRCAVPAQAWWEWDKSGRKTRVNPGEGQLFLFAGLEANGTFTVMTRDSDPELRELHHRQPVLLTPESARIWLAVHTAGPELHAVLQNTGEQEVRLEVEPPKVGGQFGMEL